MNRIGLHAWHRASPGHRSKTSLLCFDLEQTISLMGVCGCRWWCQCTPIWIRLIILVINKIIHLLLPSWTGVGLLQIWNVIDHYMVIDNDIGNVSAEIKWPWGLGFDPELASWLVCEGAQMRVWHSVFDYTLAVAVASLRHASLHFEHSPPCRHLHSSPWFILKRHLACWHSSPWFMLKYF